MSRQIHSIKNIDDSFSRALSFFLCCVPFTSIHTSIYTYLHIWMSHVYIDVIYSCCSVLQCAAVCCSVLQCVAVCCGVLQCVAVCCSAYIYRWVMYMTVCLLCHTDDSSIYIDMSHRVIYIDEFKNIWKSQIYMEESSNFWTHPYIWRDDSSIYSKRYTTHPHRKYRR